MKIAGVDPSTLPNQDFLVLPRGEDNKIVFFAKPLPDMDEFEKLCPEPTCPIKMTPKGNIPDVNNAGYKSTMEEHYRRRMAYLVIKSISEPSQIEWDTVDLGAPSTWANWESELKKNGLNQVECNLVSALALSANQLDEGKLQRAREAFLRGPQPGSGTSASPHTEAATSPSGVPANA